MQSNMLQMQPRLTEAVNRAGCGFSRKVMKKQKLDTIINSHLHIIEHALKEFWPGGLSSVGLMHFYKLFIITYIYIVITD